MGYDPKNPMVGRITDLGPKYYGDMLPPVIKENKGKWLYHEILEPGVLVRVRDRRQGLHRALRFRPPADHQTRAPLP